MRPISGQMVVPGFGPRPPFETISIEVVFFLIVAALCLLIYFKTREIYNLTKHKGVYFFRNIFLFFFLAYLFRLIFVFAVMSRELFSVAPHARLPLFGMLFVTFASIMAIFSMFMSIHHKYFRWKAQYLDLLMQTVAVVLALVVFITRSHIIMVIIMTLLFAASIIIALIKSPKHKQFTKNKTTYILLFVLWIVSMVTAPKHLLHPLLKIGLYSLSVLIFVSIYYRMKRLTNVKKA